MNGFAAGRPRRFLSHTDVGSSPNFSNQRFQKLVDGDRVTINGRPYHIVIIPDEETALRLPKDFPVEDASAYRRALSILREAAQITQRLSDRLSDSQDGKTTEGVGLLIKHMNELSPEFAQQIRGYLLAIIKNIDNFDKIRGSVFVPPCSRERFESEIGLLPADAKTSFDWNAWLDHLYNPVPKATEGFYLFETKGDWERFEASLGVDYARLKLIVQKRFERALNGAPDMKNMEKYDVASQKLMDLQRNALKKVLALAENETASGMCTRVRIRVGEDAKISFSAVNYTTEFRPELDKLADLLAKVRAALPERATELRGVLEAQEKWCRIENADTDWGLTRSEWLAAKNPRDILDCNVTCEEKVALLGAKSTFQLLVSQHDQILPALQPVWETVTARASESNINTVLLRTLIVGGFASNYVISGEKLPDPANQPQYKSSTFTNTTVAVQVRAEAEAIAKATGRTIEEALALSPTAILATCLHEFRHTRGDHAKFLGEYANYVEESNAQTGPIFYTPVFAPEMMDAIAVFEALWTPIRRARQGPLEAHSRSDLVLIDEYLKAGAVEIVEKDGKYMLHVTDLDKLVQTAHRLGLQMCLWEKGVPLDLQSSYMKPFDPANPDQGILIIKEAVNDMRLRDLVPVEPGEPESRSEREKRVIAEVKDYFSDEHMRQVAKKLEPILEGLRDVSQPLVVIPSDWRIAALVA
ncbi:MAG: hypothetical protein Q7T16_04095 [Candidatus Burarchaeum sp.]|nr:hypothetical protein [Candidatus Burarchaeum sp.]MDO8339811.1 hypothetical protein [Candidatus Burarchaeum sp.]